MSCGLSWLACACAGKEGAPCFRPPRGGVGELGRLWLSLPQSLFCLHADTRALLLASRLNPPVRHPAQQRVCQVLPRGRATHVQPEPPAGPPGHSQTLPQAASAAAALQRRLLVPPRPSRAHVSSCAAQPGATALHLAQRNTAKGPPWAHWQAAPALHPGPPRSAPTACTPGCSCQHAPGAGRRRALGAPHRLKR